MKFHPKAMVVLRVGVAFAFLYPAINALFDPDSWIGYFPAFMHGYVPDVLLLHGFGLLEIIIALWIVSGWRILAPSVLATLMLLAIVVLDASEFQILFRDVSIAGAAAALAINAWYNDPYGTSRIKNTASEPQ
jgi:hypothetical protein